MVQTTELGGGGPEQEFLMRSRGLKLAGITSVRLVVAS